MGTLSGDFGGYDPRLGTWQEILANIMAPTLAAGQRGGRGGRARGGLPGGAAPPLRLPAGVNPNTVMGNPIAPGPAPVVSADENLDTESPYVPPWLTTDS